jgi:hypothetical protein
MNTAEHLEQHLGPMDRGCSSDSLPGVQVCLFRNRPSPGVVTLTTLGLSNTVLGMSEGREVRQELLLAVRDERPAAELAKLLTYVAGCPIRRRGALLRGDVVPLGDKVEGSAGEMLHASLPVVFPEGLATLSHRFRLAHSAAACGSDFHRSLRLEQIRGSSGGCPTGPIRPLP